MNKVTSIVKFQKDLQPEPSVERVPMNKVTPMVKIQEEDAGWVVTDVRASERHGPYQSYPDAIKKAHECAPGWVYAEAEEQLAPFGDDQQVMIHLTIAGTGFTWTLGPSGEFEAAMIREAPSIRDFVLAQLDRHKFYWIDNEGQIEQVEVEEYYGP